MRLTEVTEKFINHTQQKSFITLPYAVTSVLLLPFLWVENFFSSSLKY